MEIDTRDHINSYPINYYTGETGTFEVMLSKPVNFIDTNRNEVIDEIVGFEMRFPTLEDGINAFQKYDYVKKTVTFKFLSQKDENKILAELKGLEKVSKDLRKEITTRLSHIITAVDGEDNQAVIRKFVNEELVSKDSLALRIYMREFMPDIDSTFDFVCNNCHLERKEETPIGVSFFWPNAGV